VGKEFSRVGAVPALANIGVSSKKVAEGALRRFLDIFIALNGAVPSVPHQIPGYIAFDYKPLAQSPEFGIERDPVGGPEEVRNMNRMLQYTRLLHSCQPTTKEKAEGAYHLQMEQRVRMAQSMVLAPIEETIKHAETKYNALFIDCAARLYLGLGCKRDRAAARKYMLEAALHPEATNLTRATAHAMLTIWNHESMGETIRTRYLYASLHHACLAVKSARPIAAKGHSIPQILHAFKKMTPMLMNDNPDVATQYPEVFRALKEAEDRYRRDTEASLKRMKVPLRYKCAMPGCGIEADHGMMLKKCRLATCSALVGSDGFRRRRKVRRRQKAILLRQGMSEARLEESQTVLCAG
jgi:hypothetical protein